MGASGVHPSHGVSGHAHANHHGHHLSPVGSGVVGSATTVTVAGSSVGSSVVGTGAGGAGGTVVAPGGRSPPTAGPIIAGAQHLGQPLYQEYAHAVRPRAHPVPPPVYVTAAPSQASQQQQLPTYQGFTPGWVPRHLVDACTCVPFYYLLYS